MLGAIRTESLLDRKRNFLGVCLENLAFALRAAKFIWAASNLQVSEHVSSSFQPINYLISSSNPFNSKSNPNKQSWPIHNGDRVGPGFVYSGR